ncbi:MAG TPA: SAM-dependent methyltransferase [Streptosporangiaceae bacterium]|nr:SAM-dependent methyltransferase [Streptosporangiaceae bacterium]
MPAGRDRGDARTGDRPSPEFDTSVAHIARVYNYWLGGKDNFAADRELAERFIAADPAVIAGVRANRAFLGRAVHFLVADAGIRQFLDIGTGIPTASNTHQVAQRAAPASRVVYVDNDPIVLSHARALLTSNPPGVTDYVDADLRDTATILAEAARTLDLAQPVAVMLVGIMHCVPDDDDPAGIVATLMDAIPPGSYLVISHPASDIQVEAMAAGSALLNEALAGPITFRGRAEVARLFDGLELVEPGLVSTSQWRSGAGAKPLNAWAGVARKS